MAARTRAEWVNSRARRRFVDLWIRHLGGGSIRRAAVAGGTNHTQLRRWRDTNGEIERRGYELIWHIPYLVERTVRRRDGWDRRDSFALMNRMNALLARAVRPPALRESTGDGREPDDVREAALDDERRGLAAFSEPLDETAIQALLQQVKDHAARVAEFQAEITARMRPIIHFERPTLSAKDHRRAESHRRGRRDEVLASLRRLPKNRWLQILDADWSLLAREALLMRDRAGRRYALILEAVPVAEVATSDRRKKPRKQGAPAALDLR